MLVTLTVQPTLAVRVRCSPPAMAQRVPQALNEVRAAAESQGLRVAGPAYTRYLEHHPDEGVFVLEVGVPVDRIGASAGPVLVSELPAGPAVQIWHEGPYASLGASHARLATVVGQMEKKAAGAPWESYVVGPEARVDPARWRTALTQPVAAR
jgi:effector-binding domain-containing protein